MPATKKSSGRLRPNNGKSPGSKSTQFQKGNKLGVKRGHNRLTRDLKEGIVDAAIEVGSDGKGTGGLLGYLTFLAKRHPAQYAGLLARVIPLQVTGNVGVMIGAVNIVTVPVDRYLSSEDIARLNPPLEIEGEVVKDDTAA